MIKITGNSFTKEVFIDGKLLDPKKSQAIRNHSPDGFNWGYGGSGAAQLSLAITLELFGDKHRALKIYQKFKDDVIAKLPLNKDFILDTRDTLFTSFIEENLPVLLI
jgi:hypothetical protein